MKVRPDNWPDIVVGEVDSVGFGLRPVLGALTIAEVTWACHPAGGVTFDNQTLSDGGTTVAAQMTAAQPGEYAVVATCVLSNGNRIKPTVRLRVVCEGGV